MVADFEPEFELVGLLNDDTTEVGRSTSAPSTSPTPTGERSTFARPTSSRAASPERDEVAAVVDRMETWSRLVFEALPERTAVAAVTPGRSRSL